MARRGTPRGPGRPGRRERARPRGRERGQQPPLGPGRTRTGSRSPETRRPDPDAHTHPTAWSARTGRARAPGAPPAPS
ncbi:hypothetical protein AEQ27_02340, partial [Frigoribacterium sp. RIT-PI-h]